MMYRRTYWNVAATDRYQHKETGVIYKPTTVDWGRDTIGVVEVMPQCEGGARQADRWDGGIGTFLQKFKLVRP